MVPCPFSDACGCAPLWSRDSGLNIVFCIRPFEESHLPHSVFRGVTSSSKTFQQICWSGAFYSGRGGGMKPKACCGGLEEREGSQEGEGRWAEVVEAQSLPQARPGEAPCWGSKVKRKQTLCCALPAAPPVCLLWVTNLEGPAGTNYSILMSSASSSCIWRACYLLIHTLTDLHHPTTDHLSQWWNLLPPGC